MDCRHCRVRKVSRSRGLCEACYYTPGVRRKYPPARRGPKPSGISRPDKRRSGFCVKPCRHGCGRPGWATRGLCKRCAGDLAIRELYPPIRDTGRRGVGVGVGDAPLPDAPTAALPGTPEKLAELKRRAKLRQALFHPADARPRDDWRAA